MRWLLLLSAASLVACEEPEPPSTTTIAPGAVEPPASDPDTNATAGQAPTAGATETGSARKTCYQPKTAWCLVFQVDAMTDDDRESCELLGGSLSDDACPTENALGHCVFGLQEGLGEVERVFYAIDRDPLMVDEGAPRAYTATMARRECEEDGGGDWHGGS